MTHRIVRRGVIATRDIPHTGQPVRDTFVTTDAGLLSGESETLLLIDRARALRGEREPMIEETRRAS